MEANYEKKTVCLTCRNHIMKDEYEISAHKQMGHNLYESVFGGYKKQEPIVTPPRNPDAQIRLPKKKEDKFQGDWKDDWEGESEVVE